MVEIIRFGFLGLGIGALYALASQGLIVIYRGSGVLNFALGAIGMVGSTSSGSSMSTTADPSLSRLVVGVAVSAVLGAASHLLIMRPLRHAVPAGPGHRDARAPDHPPVDRRARYGSSAFVRRPRAPVRYL